MVSPSVLPPTHLISANPLTHQNHSVVQSTFNNPCIPISDIQPATRGFFSGFMPTTGTIIPIFTLEINDTTPLWYYCSQAMHCQAGMVGVINP
jgi:hypothetical protein